VWFRIAGASLIALEQSGALFTQYSRAYVEPAVHFSYPLVSWLHPWPPAGVYAHFLTNAALALLVAAGFYTRRSAGLLCLGLVTLFLMERGVYLNHAYLYCLFAGLLAIVPCGRAASLDVVRERVAPSAIAPIWALWLLRFQMAVVYAYAGIAKLDPDWLAGRAMHVWLTDRAWYPVIGGLLESKTLALALSWGGLCFDLLVIPALLWRRTRTPALLFAIAFHATNTILFGVGTFPWFSLVATTLFLPPETFRRLPLLGAALERNGKAASSGVRPLTRIGLAALFLYVLVQVSLPLRPLTASDRTSWSEEGSSFSWRMMLRDKRGSLAVLVRDPQTGETKRESPAPYTTSWQRRTLIGSPDLILQFAHWRADEWEKRTGVRPEVRAESRVSMNGRAPRALVDPNVDLAREPRRLGAYPFTLPFDPSS
jgi:hypothetical protein